MLGLGVSPPQGAQKSPQLCTPWHHMQTPWFKKRTFHTLAALTVYCRTHGIDTSGYHLKSVKTHTSNTHHYAIAAEGPRGISPCDQLVSWNACVQTLSQVFVHPAESLHKAWMIFPCNPQTRRPEARGPRGDRLHAPTLHAAPLPPAGSVSRKAKQRTV